MRELSRARRLLAALVAATTLAGTVEVTSAAAYPGMRGCVIQQHRVHRGDSDPAKCTHLPRNHSGVAYVVQKEVHRVGPKGHKHRKVVYALYTLARFNSNKYGAATFRLKIPQRLRYGFHWVHFKLGRKSTRDSIMVVRG